MKSRQIHMAMLNATYSAMALIRENRFTFTARKKGVKGNGRVDWITNVDEAAQDLYIHLFMQAFPGVGLICEEQKINTPCTLPGTDTYMTNDPLDGTSAFKRQESQGIGTMSARVEDGIITAVFIGDVMTGEVYCYSPAVDQTFLLDGNHQIPLKIDTTLALSKQYLHLRETIDWPDHHPLIRKVAKRALGLFESTEVSGGSIGTTTARLWAGHVGGCVLSSREITPWDNTPILGMCQRLGFMFIRPNANGTAFEEIHPKPIKHVFKPSIPDMLIIHQSRVHEFASWCAFNNIGFIAKP